MEKISTEVEIEENLFYKGNYYIRNIDHELDAKDNELNYEVTWFILDKEDKIYKSVEKDKVEELETAYRKMEEKL